MSLKRELVFIDEVDKTEEIESYELVGRQVSIKFKNNNRAFLYGQKRVKLVKTALSSDSAYNTFEYIKELAKITGLKDEDDRNILADNFDSIKHVSCNVVLSDYLNSKLINDKRYENQLYFPFGFNLSQKEAVNKAFRNKISVIEGPPGTGKTQTTLNIIANAVMQKMSVAVVSSNNSATSNVYEKLGKNNLNFFAAILGSSANKELFFKSQSKEIDLSEYEISSEELVLLNEDAIALNTELSDLLKQKDELASLKLQLEHLTTESSYFLESTGFDFSFDHYFNRNTTSKLLLKLWIALENESISSRKLGFFKRILFQFKFRIGNKQFFKNTFDKMILICQIAYYEVKLKEIDNRILELEKNLIDVDFKKKMDDYSKISMSLFRSNLYVRYSDRKRKKYNYYDLQHNVGEFVEDYPVVLSTTYSLKKSLSKDFVYDLVIVDEASQVDLVTGALAMSCAKNIVIVGDRKQLPNVVTSEIQGQTDFLFNSYPLKSPYRYATNSLLSSILSLFPEVPTTLLKEHYRCHPKIIDFCNQKFYNNQLIIHTNKTFTREPMLVYKTVAGNHAREKYNQRQIDVIKNEIIPNENLQEEDLGIVTPYRNQTNILQKTFSEENIKADTVDKFQGRENKVIILSTVDNEISEFTDNANRLNVAVSRAEEQLILLINGNESESKDGNINDLLNYIEYQNFEVKESQLNSVFDLLYKDLERERQLLIEKSGKVSEFDSENLMNALIKEVLEMEEFSKYDVVLHMPLRNVIKDFSILNDEQFNYANNSLTHFDFLIYNKLGKIPVLAVEVDGYAYHLQGSKQEERDTLKDEICGLYNLPMVRFKTNESNERNRLVESLQSLSLN